MSYRTKYLIVETEPLSFLCFFSDRLDFSEKIRKVWPHDYIVTAKQKKFGSVKPVFELYVRTYLSRRSGMLINDPNWPSMKKIKKTWHYNSWCMYVRRRRNCTYETEKYDSNQPRFAQYIFRLAAIIIKTSVKVCLFTYVHNFFGYRTKTYFIKITWILTSVCTRCKHRW